MQQPVFILLSMPSLFCLIRFGFLINCLYLTKIESPPKNSFGRCKHYPAEPTGLYISFANDHVQELGFGYFNKISLKEQLFYIIPITAGKWRKYISISMDIPFWGYILSIGLANLFIVTRWVAMSDVYWEWRFFPASPVSA